MARKWLMAVSTVLVFSGTAGAEPQGLVTKSARYPVVETVERLDKVLRDTGMIVFAVIDHAAAAQKAGLRMPPAQVIVFGNPKGGTPMMLSAPTIAIDLPVKILVWEDSAGKAWLAYNTASYIAERHQLKGMDNQVQGLDAALRKFTASVVH